MKSFLTFCASLAAATALSLPANAAHDTENWPRWYVGLSGGVSFLQDTDLSGASVGEASADTGAAFTGALGYTPYFGSAFFDNFRIEAELGYRFNDLDNASIGGVNVPLNGDITAFSYMANLFYDFNNASQWTPYVGGGAGGARVKVDGNSGLGNTSDSDTVFAYQLMTGVTYAPKSMPFTEWGLGYRYFNASEPEFSTAGGPLKLDDLASHNVEVGARFRF